MVDAIDREPLDADAFARMEALIADAMRWHAEAGGLLASPKVSGTFAALGFMLAENPEWLALARLGLAYREATTCDREWSLGTPPGWYVADAPHHPDPALEGRSVVAVDRDARVFDSLGDEIEGYALATMKLGRAPLPGVDAP